jgi:hypothetical protein
MCSAHRSVSVHLLFWVRLGLASLGTSVKTEDRPYLILSTLKFFFDAL